MHGLLQVDVGCMQPDWNTGADANYELMLTAALLSCSLVDHLMLAAPSLLSQHTHGTVPNVRCVSVFTGGGGGTERRRGRLW